MNKFKFDGIDHIIVEEKKGETERGFWEEKITNVVRTRDIFAWRPWWVGKDIRWLKKITVTERLVLGRRTSFDDGWSYQHVWGLWEPTWEAIKIK